MRKTPFIIAAVATCALAACGSNNAKTEATGATPVPKPTYDAIVAAKWLCGAWTCPAGDAMVI